MRRAIKTAFENLEKRLCLTVAASLSDDGDLFVEGDADGAVEITAVDAGTFEVTDNGTVVATIEGVTDDIRIRLEGEDDGANDNVTLNLGDEAVDKVYANLGDGDNMFVLAGGTIERGAFYHGSDGSDQVSLDSTIEYLAYIRLGDGDNSLSHAGTIEEGSLRVFAGDGNDSVSLASGATVDGSVKLDLGDGDNALTMEGTVERNVFYRGRDGNDTVTLAESAQVGGSVVAKLGDGENSLTHSGTIDGDLIVRSQNEDDVVDVADTATVGGTTEIGLGEEGGAPFGHCAGMGRLFRGFGFGGSGFRALGGLGFRTFLR